MYLFLVFVVAIIGGIIGFIETFGPMIETALILSAIVIAIILIIRLINWMNRD